MADTLCGPSNPLQNFQKHTSVDRSLQQDRLASRAGPSSQGFRSDAGASAGILDPEFLAFQEGRAPALADARGPVLQPAHHSFQPPQQQTPGLAGWASDFQRLHISQPPANSQAQAIPSPSSWHLDFQRQRNGKRPAPQQSQLQQSAPVFQQVQPAFDFHSTFRMQQPYGYGPMTQSSQWDNLSSQAPQQMEDFDAAAFEQEFEAHATRLLQEAQSQAQSQSTSIELGQDVLVDGPDVLQSFDENSTWSNLANPPRYQLDGVGNLQADIIFPEERPKVAEPKQQEESPADRAATDEDLARTAGELLQRVRDDTSVKFRESNFLQLMAQLRDGEVRVEGNDFVATNDAITSKTADPTSALDSESRYARNLSSFESTTASQRQRPSSVPPRRNPIPMDRPDGDLHMAGALGDPVDRPLRSPSIGRGRREPDRDFDAFLNEHGVPSTHMVDDF